MPMFLRTKVGAAEILNSLLWPKALFPEDKYLLQFLPVVQELVLFTDFTNDILSCGEINMQNNAKYAILQYITYLEQTIQMGLRCIVDDHVKN